jgi:hypothetical protein
MMESTRAFTDDELNAIWREVAVWNTQTEDENGCVDADYYWKLAVVFDMDADNTGTATATCSYADSPLAGGMSYRFETTLRFEYGELQTEMLDEETWADTDSITGLTIGAGAPVLFASFSEFARTVPVQLFRAGIVPIDVIITRIGGYCPPQATAYIGQCLEMLRGIMQDCVVTINDRICEEHRVVRRLFQTAAEYFRNNADTDMAICPAQ